MPSRSWPAPSRRSMIRHAPRSCSCETCCRARKQLESEQRIVRWRITGGDEHVLPANQELASQVGTVREVISRNLGRLQAEGIIRLDGKRLIVPDPGTLSES